MKKQNVLASLMIASFAASAFACSDSDSTDDKGKGGVTDVELVKTVKSALSYEASTIDNAQLNAFVKGQYDLNFDIMKRAESDFAGKNAMISTFSIQNAIAMLWAGAAGDTADQIKAALRFDDNTHQALNKLNAIIKSKNLPAWDSDYGDHIDPVEVNTTNDLYLAPNHTWSSSWLDTLAVNYDAGIQETQFAKDPAGATKYINDVVAKDTHDRIQNLIPDGGIDATTQLVLTNAIYMKAPWSAEFHKKGQMSFTKQDESSVKADKISASSFFAYVDQDNYQAALVPLRQNTFSVLFILPDEGQFEAVQSSMNGDMIDSIFSSVTREANVHFSMPTFEFTTELEMSSKLKEMGMVNAFSDRADFSGLTEDHNEMYVSAVFHKSFIAMNEDGVEAAAATAVAVAENGMAPVTKEVFLDLDRPFIFVIYETDTKTPLFFGRLMDPTQSN